MDIWLPLGGQSDLFVSLCAHQQFSLAPAAIWAHSLAYWEMLHESKWVAHAVGRQGQWRKKLKLNFKYGLVRVI